MLTFSGLDKPCLEAMEIFKDDLGYRAIAEQDTVHSPIAPVAPFYVHLIIEPKLFA